MDAEQGVATGELIDIVADRRDWSPAPTLFRRAHSIKVVRLVARGHGRGRGDQEDR